MSSICACRSVGGALSPRVSGEGGAAERLRVQLHGAKLDRSFAKTAGWMDPYAVVSVDGREVHRTSPALWSHKTPSWESGCTICAAEMPSSLSVAVWTQNRLRKDVLCGMVALPCAEDMCTLKQKEFAITNDAKIVGSITLSVVPLGGQTWTAARMNSMKSVESVLGAEMDNLANFLDDDAQPGGAENEDKGAGFSRAGSMVMAEPGANASVCLRSEDKPAQPPTLLSPKRSTDSLKKPQAEAVIDCDELIAAEEKEKAGTAEVVAEAAQEEAKCGEDDLARPLAGNWHCVATNGLEEFLKATGVPAFYRRFALSARWPSWEFNVTKGHVHFINHSAMGDLHERIPLDGSDYIWKDGRGNPLTCSSTWQPSADGGVLTTKRAGTVSGNSAKFSETRKVSGNTLVFELDNGDGLTWGRTFERKA